MTFGEKLKRLRTQSKITQSELAKMIDCKNTAISNWEKDINKPNIEALSRICNALNTNASYFIGTDTNTDKYTYTEKEKRHIKKYHELDSHGKKVVDVITDFELERMQSNVPENVNDDAPKEDFETFP